MSEQVDHDFLQAYTQELDFLRQMSGEFAKAYPAVAGRLDLSQFDCEDPWVERLLEGVAFLTARVQRELDGGLPHLAQSLVKIAEPRAGSPIPSFSIIEMTPAGDQIANRVMPAGSGFNTDIPDHAKVPCHWRTLRRHVLRPAGVQHAEMNNVGNPPLGISLTGGELSWLTLQISVSHSRKLMGHDGPLTFQLQGPPEFPGQLLMALRSGCTRIAVCDEDSVLQWLEPEHLLEAIDLENPDSQELDAPPEMLLMQRYAALPQQFHAFAIGGIRADRLPDTPGTLSVRIFMDASNDEIANRIRSEMFKINAVPTINLIRRRSDRIILDDRSDAHQIMVDRTRPMDFEVYSVEEVMAIDSEGRESMHLRSIYDLRDQDARDTGFFSLSLRPRPDSQSSLRKGRRAGYRGTETMVSLSIPTPQARERISQLASTVWCTNRDVAMLLPSHATCHSTDDFKEIARASIMIGPSEPRMPESDISRQWNLLGHLGHGFIRMLDQPDDQHDTGSLQSILANYIDPEDLPARKQVSAITRITGRTIVRRRLVGRRAAEMRGIACTIEISQSSIRSGVDVYTLPLVISRYLLELVPIGGFIEFTVVDDTGKELCSWMPMDGHDSLI